VIISGKGGVGKTTSAINLGSILSTLGKEVIIVDANLSTPNVGLHLGSPIVPITLNHVMKNKAKIEEAIYEHESGTKIMPASLSIDEFKKINHSKLSNITRKLRKISDNIILDSSAGLGREAKEAIKASDEIIIVTNPEMSAVTDALKAIKIAENMNKNIKGCIITRQEGKNYEMDLDSIKDMLEVPLLGVIPEDKSIKESQSMKNPVIITHPKSKASKAYKKIAKRLLGKGDDDGEYLDLTEEDEKPKKPGFFARLFGFGKKKQ
jgi:septum site-determining protein MinD